jgi:hypothetical protein
MSRLSTVRLGCHALEARVTPSATVVPGSRFGDFSVGNILLIQGTASRDTVTIDKVIVDGSVKYRVTENGVATDVFAFESANKLHVWFFGNVKDFNYGTDVVGFVKRAPWYRGKEPPSWEPVARSVPSRENATALTPSSCPFRSRASGHSFTSPPPSSGSVTAAIRRPSGDTAIPSTLASCGPKTRRVSPVPRSPSRIVRSPPPDRSRAPSGVHASAVLLDHAGAATQARALDAIAAAAFGLPRAGGPLFPLES